MIRETERMGRQMVAPAAMIILALMLTGCVAGTRGGPIPSNSAKLAGIRYFLPALYLVVQQTPEGALSASFEVLADSSQAYFVEPYIILAKQNIDITLNGDGTLQSFKLEQDGTPVSAAIVAAVKDISLKKFELEKAAAEARSGTPSASVQDDGGRASKMWVFQVNGGTATRLTGVPQTVAVPSKPTSEGSGATGAIEGKFSVTIGGSAAGSPVREKKLSADRTTAPDKAWLVAYKGHPFTEEDVKDRRVEIHNVKPEHVKIEKGVLRLSIGGIEGDGATVKYEGESVGPLKPF